MSYKKEVYFKSILSAEESSLTGTFSYKEKIKLITSVIPSGEYKISWCYNWRANKFRNSFIARVQIDDTETIHSQNEETKTSKSGQKNTVSGFFNKTFTSSGSHEIDLDFSTLKLDSTVYISEARIEIKEVDLY